MRFALASILLLPALARADALPPQATCPRGKLLQPSHGGGTCVDEKPSCPPEQIALPNYPGFSCAERAPTNCPNGWRGVTDLVGGARCVVAECADAPCAAGETCTAHPVCQEERRTYQFTEGDRASRTLFAGPPVERTVKVTTGLCPAPGEATPPDFACATCVASRVCLRGDAAPALTAPPPPAAPTTSVAPVAPPGGGCGSCRSGADADVAGSAALAAASIAFFVVRRRRRA